LATASMNPMYKFVYPINDENEQNVLPEEHTTYKNHNNNNKNEEEVKIIGR
jgi:hypothetical protein